MQVIPALDLRAGAAVRLRQGNYDDEIRYTADPREVVASFVEAGAELIHVVDLDSARDGHRRHAELIGELSQIAGAHIELGGGVRTRKDVRAALDLGVARVVMGTAAVEQPDEVAALCTEFPGSIVLGFDVRDGIVATRGWESGSGLTLEDLLARYADAPVAAVIVTEISRDGMLIGPDPAPALRALDLTTAEVIVSGGVGTANDIAVLTEHRSQTGRAIDGVIVGRALYEGALAIDDAFAAARSADG